MRAYSVMTETWEHLKTVLHLQTGCTGLFNMSAAVALQLCQYLYNMDTSLGTSAG